MMQFQYDKPLAARQQSLVLLNSGSIDRYHLTNYANQYRALGGTSIPDEIVNMIFVNTYEIISMKHEFTTAKTAFLLISETIQASSRIRGKELWRLSNSFCQLQYGFNMNYSSWLFHKLLRTFI